METCNWRVKIAPRPSAAPALTAGGHAPSAKAGRSVFQSHVQLTQPRVRPSTPLQSFTNGFVTPGLGAAVITSSAQYFTLPLTVSVLFRPDSPGSRGTSVVTFSASTTGEPCAPPLVNCPPFFAITQPAANQPFGVRFEPADWPYSAGTNFSANQTVFPTSGPGLNVGQWTRLTAVFAVGGGVALFRSGSATPVGAGVHVRRGAAQGDQHRRLRHARTTTL